MSEVWLQRTELLLGKEKLAKISNSMITVVGLGGVGSYAVESLVRSGIKHIRIIDFDIVNETNLNRQIIALNSTIGLKKTEVMKARVLDINPKIEISVISEFLRKDISQDSDSKSIERLDILKDSDYIIDAIDSIGPKMGMIKDLCSLNIPFISVLGAGNRLDPEKIKITSIWQTSGCPLAKRLKKLLRRNGVNRDFPVVFSEEKPIKDFFETKDQESNNDHDNIIPKSVVGSISYMPAIMGMMATSWVIRHIANN
ncbi:MAG: tRNA threonylcarbamoyladenosine dehydratase [Candidatus Cloacimonetes bacterium]|jgi:tRNA A37 threonylcarbamoyladenosine dehydratase|nr:tRNA threonylcarbamoyladenosine dehydratase [Candidatus Cloacimonadota bacterium]